MITRPPPCRLEGFRCALLMMIIFLFFGVAALWRLCPERRALRAAFCRFVPKNRICLADIFRATFLLPPFFFLSLAGFWILVSTLAKATFHLRFRAGA